jgi:hypothetical protein
MHERILYFVGPMSLVVMLMGIVWSCNHANRYIGESADSTVELRYFNGPTSGAIFTVHADGSRARATSYAAKADVHLAGGPGVGAPSQAGALPPGDYYFQVTDASGQDLLSSDHISCRKLHVNDAGVIAKIHRGTNYIWRNGGWVEVDCHHYAGLDLEHGQLGGLTVRLYPFDNTPNLAGMYKVWLLPVGQYLGDPNYVPRTRSDPVNGEGREPGDYHGFVAADAKIHGFRVEPGELRPQQLSVRTFHDADADAVWDADEPEIKGWELTFDDPLGGSNRAFTPSELLTEPGRWALLTGEPPDSRLTVSLRNGKSVSRIPEADPLQVVVIDPDGPELQELVFGHVGLGSVRACKIYDVDGDGEVDDDELGVAGWRFRLGGTDVRGQPVGPINLRTEADGCASFVGLLPGRYTVEELSRGGDWVASGPAGRAVLIQSELDGVELAGTTVEIPFTNYCQGTAAFAGIDDWLSAQALAEIGDPVIGYINTLRPFKHRSRYFTGGDEPFDGIYNRRRRVGAVTLADGTVVAEAGSAQAELARFLLEPSELVAERLAQQLLVFVLNVHLRVRDIGAAIQRPGGKFVTCDELISEVTAAWASTDVAAQVELERLLDAVNTSSEVRFIHDHACRLP